MMESESSKKKRKIEEVESNHQPTSKKKFNSMRFKKERMKKKFDDKNLNNKCNFFKFHNKKHLFF